MTCERAKELMIDALVEPLDDARLNEFKDHIETCQSCAAEAASVEHIWHSLETVAIPDPKAGGAARLKQAVVKEFGVDFTPGTSTVKSTDAGTTGWRIAAAILLVAIGSLLTIGLQNYLSNNAGDTVVDNRSRYVLIMTETQEPAEQFAQVQAEINAWADDLFDRGIVETGFGLADQAPVGIPPDGALMDLNVSGFMVIRADNAQEARRIAVSSPIINYGGLIEIRELAGNNQDE